MEKMGRYWACKRCESTILFIFWHQARKKNHDFCSLLFCQVTDQVTAASVHKTLGCSSKRCKVVYLQCGDRSISMLASISAKTLYIFLCLWQEFLICVPGSWTAISQFSTIILLYSYLMYTNCACIIYIWCWPDDQLHYFNKMQDLWVEKYHLPLLSHSTAGKAKEPLEDFKSPFIFK